LKDSLKGWNKVENRFKALQSGADVNRRRRNRIAALGVIMLLLSFALLDGCHRDPNVRKHKYLESGERYSAQGKDKEAAIQFSNALKIDKNFADAYYARSKVYLHMGEFSAAYADLQWTVNLQPANVKARLDLGSLLLAANKINEAQAQAAAVLALQPNNADLHALLSNIAARQGQKDVALAEIHRALVLAPNEAALHVSLALLEAGDPAQNAAVEAELKQAVALEPKNVRAKLLLSAFYVRNNRLQEAEQIGWTAIATDPKNLSARENVAQIVLREGDQRRAEEVLRQASKDLSDNSRGVRLLADYYAGTGQLDRARAEFAALAQKYPKNVSVKEGYVRVLLDVKDYGTAQAVVNDLMKKNSKDPQVAVLNGIVLLNSGKANDAVNALQSAANDAPKDAFIQRWLGKAALAKGDTGLAEKCFQQAVQLNQRDLEAWEELARIASLRGDMSMLADVAEKTIALAPRFSGGYVWRATAEIARSAPGKAEADLKTAIGIAPQSSQAYLLLGELYNSQKHYPEGAAQLAQALQYDPNSVAALHGLVSYDLLKKQPAQALARLNAQIAKSPKNSGFYDLLAQLQIENKNFDQAAATAQKAMQLNPDDSEAVSIYAQLQAARGQVASAIGTWQQWTKTHPGNAGVLTILGMLEEARGNKWQAEEDYKKALQLQPAQALAANNLAYLMLENHENVDVALTLAQTARRGMPNSPSSADTLAWAYYYKGTYGFARDLLENAIKINPNSPAMQYHLGMVYGKLSDKNNAVIHLKKAIALAPNSPAAKDAQSALQKLG
jgi:tetratricopeptide (TPR) repeat protein